MGDDLPQNLVVGMSRVGFFGIVRKGDFYGDVARQTVRFYGDCFSFLPQNPLPASPIVASSGHIRADAIHREIHSRSRRKYEFNFQTSLKFSADDAGHAGQFEAYVLELTRAKLGHCAQTD